MQSLPIVLSYVCLHPQTGSTILIKRLAEPVRTNSISPVTLRRFVAVQAPCLKMHLFKSSARLVLVAYTMLMLKPVMPIIVDGMAHTFWANVHVRTVHTHNGKEHVHYELRKAVGESDRDKAGLTLKFSADESYHLASVALVIPDHSFPLPPDSKAVAYYLRTCNDVDRLLESPPPKRA